MAREAGNPLGMKKESTFPSSGEDGLCVLSVPEGTGHEKEEEGVDTHPPPRPGQWVESGGTGKAGETGGKPVGGWRAQWLALCLS